MIITAKENRMLYCRKDLDGIWRYNAWNAAQWQWQANTVHCLISAAIAAQLRALNACSPSQFCDGRVPTLPSESSPRSPTE